MKASRPLACALVIAVLGCLSGATPSGGESASPASASAKGVRVEIRNDAGHAVTVRAERYMDRVRAGKHIYSVVQPSTFGGEAEKKEEEEEQEEGEEGEVRWAIEVHAPVAFVVHRSTRRPRARDVVDVRIPENPNFTTVSVR